MAHFTNFMIDNRQGVTHKIVFKSAGTRGVQLMHNWLPVRRNVFVEKLNREGLLPEADEDDPKVMGLMITFALPLTLSRTPRGGNATRR